MIRVFRSSKPAILLKKEREWLDVLHRAATPTARENALSKYRHKEIQSVLSSMFHGKCAYCESHIGHISFAHIEHYRPKSKFPDLAFDWDNLLLACGMCNSTGYKGDEFPESDDGGPIINPCQEEPEDHFDFKYDVGTKIASVYGKTQRGKTTETLLGLNRKELREYRSRQITRLAALANLAQSDPEAQRLLEEACKDEAEYAAFARTLSG